VKSETFDSTLPCTTWRLSWPDAKSDHSEHSFYMGMDGYRGESNGKSSLHNVLYKP